MKTGTMILLLIVFFRISTFAQDTLSHIAGSCINSLKTEVACPVGINFEYSADTLKIYGMIGANCCGAHFVEIEKLLGTINITSIDTGMLCTCGCLYCFEIRIPATVYDTIVKLNGSEYNIKALLNSIGDSRLEDNLIELFPNPTVGNVSVKLNGGIRVENIIITDISGRIIRMYNSFRNVIELNDFPVGAYIINFETDRKQRISKRIIKK